MSAALETEQPELLSPEVQEKQLVADLEENNVEHNEITRIVGLADSTGTALVRGVTKDGTGLSVIRQIDGGYDVLVDQEHVRGESKAA